MARPTDWNAIGLDADPTPGDPDQIRTLATELNNLGTSAREISTAIDAVMNTAGDSVFVGQAADALRGKVDDRLRGHIEDVASSFETAATALTGWADKLTELQQRADGALSSGRGLSEDDPQRETYASTARQAGTEHGEGASSAAGSVRGVSHIQLPISKCQIFWEAFQWLAIILIVPALLLGGPIALLAFGVNLTLFIKTVVDFANGDAKFLDLFLAGLGILAPTTRALPIFQIIKGVGRTAFARGFANVARGTFQALRSLFTNGFRPTTLLFGLRDLVRLSGTWIRRGGLWVLNGLHNLPGVIGRGLNSAGLTIVQGFRGIPAFVRGLPQQLSRGWQATTKFMGEQFGGTKWLRLFLPVDAAEIGQYGLRGALRIGFVERGVFGQHVFGAPLTGALGRSVSAIPVDPRTVDALVDLPRTALSDLRVQIGAGGHNGLRSFDVPAANLDVVSAIRPPSLHLGDVGSIAHRGNFGVHAARTVDALVDMPRAQLGSVRAEGFGALPGRADQLGVSVGGTPTVMTPSGLHVPASAGVPGSAHGLTNAPASTVPGGVHGALTGTAPAPNTLASATDVLLPGGAHNSTHAPGTVLTGTQASPPPVSSALGNVSAPGTTSPGTLHAALTGTPGVGTVHTPGTSGIGGTHATPTGAPHSATGHGTPPSPTTASPHGVTAPHSLLTGSPTGAHPTTTGAGGGVSALDLLAGGGRSTPDSPVTAGTGATFADRTSNALTANQTRLHLDELLHSPGSPRTGTPSHQLSHASSPPSPSPAPPTPDRLTANPTAHDTAVGGTGQSGAHTRAALDLLDTGRSARATETPAFAGTPASTDADKGLAGSAHGNVAPSTHAPVTPPEPRTALPTQPSPAPAAHTSDNAASSSVSFDSLLKERDVVRVPGGHELAVKAPRGAQPELHGGAAGSGLFTVEKNGPTGFVVRQLEAAGSDTVIHSWSYRRMGMRIGLADQTVRLTDGPLAGTSVKFTDKTADTLADAGANWPVKLSGDNELVVASPSGAHVYDRATGALVHSSTPDVTLPARPAHLTGSAADTWDAAAHAARGHLGRAATDNDVKLFMQGVIGGAFTSKKGYGGFLNPGVLDANPGLIDKVKQFNKVTDDLMFEGPNQRMTVWRGVSMDPRAAQADHFFERLPASTSNNRDFQAEWARNGVSSNRVIFEIDVPANHGKLAMAYPPGYAKAGDDALALNQDQWEITLSPTKLVRTGPARIEDGITVIPVRAEQIPGGQLDSLITERWSGLPSGEAFEDFGRAFGQDSLRRWDGLGDAAVRESGNDPHVRTFVVSRPGFADELTITVTHKPADNAVSVTMTGGAGTFSKEWSGTGYSHLAADLRGNVLHNNDLFNSLPTPASWERASPSPSPRGGAHELPAHGTRLTPTEIEQAWFRDGERVDQLFGSADDPARGLRREAWRDHVQARYDLGRAEDLLHNGKAGGSSAPSPTELRIRERIDNAREQYQNTHHRLTDLGVDPARMETDLAALRNLSLSERPRLLGGTQPPTSEGTPATSAATQTAPPPAAHTSTDAAPSAEPPKRLDETLGEHTTALRDLQRLEASQSQVGKSVEARAAAKVEMDAAKLRVAETTTALDDALRRDLTSGQLSQRELNQLVDQFAGAGDIQRARVLQEHALGLDVRARELETGSARSDQFIRTGAEVEGQSLEVQRRAQELEDLVRAGGQSPERLRELANELVRSADDLDSALQGFVKDAARFGGTYTLRNQHAPVATVARMLARRVDDAARVAEPGALLDLKGFRGTAASLTDVRGLAGLARRYRTNKAYGEVPTGEQWKAVLPGEEGQWKAVFGDFDKLSRAEQTSFVRTLSEENLKALRAEVGALLDGMEPAERKMFEALRDRLENLPYRIKHATPAYHAIANSGVMSSQGDLARRGIRFLASGKSSVKNTSNLGNDDFVFFRMEVGDEAMATRYGPTTLVFDAKVLKEEGGWVSLHDQLHPLDRETMRRLDFDGKSVRNASYDKGFDEVGKRARWTYEYPDGGGLRKVSFEQEVFHGRHVQEALSLSVVREVARIGGDFRSHVFKLMADLDNPQALGSVVSKLYRPEAKFASGLPINPVGSTARSEWPMPLKVVDENGDGRYFPDGTVDPAARAAGKQFDEASDRVRQADTAIAGGQNKSVGYHLRKAQLHARQSVDLTQEFHAAAVGERKVLAQTLLDQRVKLLDDITEKIAASKAQPRPPVADAPGASTSAAATSARPASPTAPQMSDLTKELPQSVEDAFKAVFPEATEAMKKMARVLGNSDGFRVLENSKDGAQTTAAVDLGRTAFDKAFKALVKKGLVVGRHDGLHLTDDGRALLLPDRAKAETSAPPSTTVSDATDLRPGHGTQPLPDTGLAPAPRHTHAATQTSDLTAATTVPHGHLLQEPAAPPHTTVDESLTSHTTTTETASPHPLDTNSSAARTLETDPTVKDSPTAHPIAEETPTAPHTTGNEPLSPHPADPESAPPHPLDADTTPRHTADDPAAPPHTTDDPTPAPAEPRPTTTTPVGHPADVDLLDTAVFRSRTATPEGVRFQSRIHAVDRALAAFHRVPADQLGRRAAALDELAGAARRFVEERPGSARRPGVEELLNQVDAEATAHRLLEEHGNLGATASFAALDDLATRTRAALSAGGAGPAIHARLQDMLTTVERQAGTHRLLTVTETAVRLAAPIGQPTEAPWAGESGDVPTVPGSEGRPTRSAGGGSE
ncbi:hypothetical protein [Streptomyces sp. NPDC086787]|uniref:hypothetical protein n=1 Tax=Streptomyces sp. NPDC086787 TaxID=3365759 RepID=UPI00381554E9